MIEQESFDGALQKIDEIIVPADMREFIAR